MQAARSLLRARGHSALVIATLALGIGTTTAIASVVYGVLLRPLPFPDAERLLMLWQRAPGVGVAEDWFSPAQYFDLREQVDGFEALALVFGVNVTLTGDDNEPERLGGLTVSSSFFDVLGMKPLHGRLLSPEDDLPGAPVKALVGNELFRRRFGGDPGIVGETITVDGERIEVVGVLPPSMLDPDVLPTLATVPFFDLVMSLPIEDPQRTTHGSENYNVLAKVAAGVSLDRVETELLGVAREFVRDPGSLGAGLDAGTEYRIGIVPLLEQVVGSVRAPLWALLAATALLHLVACANVAGLLQIRAARNYRDLGIRAALGASRKRMVLDSMIGSAVLAGISGLAGLGLASLLLRALHLLSPEQLPRLEDIRIDPAVLLLVAGLSLATCLVFGFLPALRAAQVSPMASVRASALGASSGRYFVVVQVALSLVLSASAAILMSAYRELRAVEPGFDSEDRLTFRVSLAGPLYQDPAARSRFFGLFFDGLRDREEVIEAGGISMLPLTRGYAWTDFLVEGLETPDGRDRIVADVHVVTEGYFEAMGIPLLAGRSFTRADDDEPRVAIVNRSFAERFWKVEDAVGKWLARDPEQRVTILGVVEDVKHYGLSTDARLTVFYPHRASRGRTLYGVAQTKSPVALAATVRAVASGIDPNLPVYDVRPMSERLHGSLSQQRVLMALGLLFGAVALALTSVGVYGVLAYSVAARNREIGIRAALGADPGRLFHLVLRSTGRLAGSGILLGVLASFGATPLLDRLVYGVSTRDPLSIALGVVVVALVAGAASLSPARRAARVSPIVALKE